MIRVVILYEAEVDPERYAEHAELCRAVPGATFRHGPVFGVPFGEQLFHHYAEFEFPDKAAFAEISRSPEFGATAKDAMAMGVPFHAHFAEIQ